MKILMIGAHQDDNEFCWGGLAHKLLKNDMRSTDRSAAAKSVMQRPMRFVSMVHLWLER